MKRSFSKRLIPLLVAVVLVLTTIPMAVSAAQPKVKVSETAYNVNIDTPLGFVSNTKPLSGKVGEEMYMTYTVSKVGEVTAHQQGLVGSDSKSDRVYLYTNGGLMCYKNGDPTNMFKEGYTYFIKFVTTKDGFEYTMAIAKGNESSYYALPSVWRDTYTTKMKFLGLWFDGGPSKVELTNVHIYDKNGNDLGVSGSTGIAAMEANKKPTPSATDVNHTYTVSVEKQYNVRLGNKIKNTTDEMYIEYTVKSSKSKNYQSGLWLNMAHITGGGSTQYTCTNVTYDPQHVEATEISQMLIPGAKYLVKMYNTHTDEGWDYLIQRTYKGETEWFKFTSNFFYTPSTKNFGYSALVYGEGPYHYSTFTLSDVRIYDANHKNLGVQLTVPGTIEHKGEMISYENCDSVYYNAEKDVYIATYPDKTIEITNKDGVTKQGTFSVQDSTPGDMTAVFGSEKQKYKFYLAYLIDADGNRYDALGEYKISFVTGTDKTIKTQILSPENGYKVKKPADPKVDGDEFVAWVTVDGKEFDFDKIQTSSKTLYAKWKNRAGKTYVAVDGEGGKVDAAPFIAIGLAVVIVAVAVAGSIIVVRRFKKQ